MILYEERAAISLPSLFTYNNSVLIQFVDNKTTTQFWFEPRRLRRHNLT